MEIQKKGNEIIIRKKLTSKETYKISKSKKRETISFYKKPSKIKGMASSTEDGKDVLFIDYDNTDKKVVLNDYKLLQGLFRLPQGYLFESSENSYHVVCLRKFKPSEIYHILSFTHTDSAYMSMPLRNLYKNWVLRIGTKKSKGRPKTRGIIGKPQNVGTLSKAHYDFLNKIFPNLENPKYNQFDKLKKICLQEYES